MKERGYWRNLANVRAAINELREELGRFPTRTEISGRFPGLPTSVRNYHGGLRRVLIEMGREKVRHPPGYWAEWSHAEAALREVIQSIGRFPTFRDLLPHGLSALAKAIPEHYGGWEKVRERMGYAHAPRVPVVQEPKTTVRPSGHWVNFGNVHVELQRVAAELGHFPLEPELEARGLGGLYAAIAVYHGGVAAVRERMGFDVIKRPVGYWREFSNVERELRLLVDADGALPNEQKLRKLGRSDLAAAVRRHGGYFKVREKLGLETRRRPPSYWKEWTNVESCLENAIQRLGHFPSPEELAEIDAGAPTSIRTHHGGLSAVRERMGYGPISDEFLANNADILSQIILVLKDPDHATFWDRLKRKWLERDLNNAIEDYERDGSVERFRVLLDG